MNASLVHELTGAADLYKTSDAAKGIRALQGETSDGTLFSSVFNTAVENIKTTNAYLSDAENQEILFALGQSDSAHDLTIALEKAQTALQYTVAIRDRLLEAYKELMQMQV
ncbi:MAG: flagellar hook-basal body complex protein FliE [Lachnospiraceae bacterium]|nr:flagellar hook-basal body complex protein FliE [Lachnospiraceae bacterium]MBP1585146.1 flagellar hook-basal body complex protein FliE [Lachnospiraceae bacterium]